MSLLAETTQSVLKNGSRAEIDLEELEDATGRVEAYRPSATESSTAES